MLDFQQKKQIRKVIYSRLSIFALFIIVIFLARSTYDIYKRKGVSAEGYASVKKSYDNLKGREAMLDSEIARLKTDQGVEEEIRGKFNVAKPGETIVTIIDSSSSTSTDKNGNKKGFWATLASWFK